ncbi:MAG: hypothetical protein AABY13_02905, partial [Nanoarchaeota archaeon]
MESLAIGVGELFAGCDLVDGRLAPYGQALAERRDGCPEGGELAALHEGDKPKMWPGPAVTLRDVQPRNAGIDLLVSQTSFPAIDALKDKTFSELYETQGITKPRPALAICTYAITTDGMLALTVRGARTNMYPGRLYGQGGNPRSTNTNVVEHQKAENKDEILVQDNEYPVNGGRGFWFGGIVEDNEQLPRKTDLVGWCYLNIDSKTLKGRSYERPMEKRPNDAVGIVFAPAKEGPLLDYLTKTTHPVQFCPPAHAGLVVYGLHKFGNEWAQNVIKKIE